MGVANVAQVQAMFLERVLPDMPTLWGVEDAFCTWIQPGKSGAGIEIQKVSDRAMRIVFKAGRGGVSGQVDLNGGSFFRGTGTLFKQFTVTTVGFQHAREMTTKAIEACKGDQKALERLSRHEIAQAMIEMKAAKDRRLQVDASQVLAILNTVVNAPTYSVKGGATGQAGNPWGAQLLEDNGLYDVWDTGLAVLRQAGAAVVQDAGVDYPGQNVTFTQAIPGAVIGDKIVTAGSGQAGFAGLPTFVNDSATGFLQGQPRNLPYCQVRSVDAGGAALSLDFIRQSLNLIKIRKPGASMKTLTPYIAPQQEHAYEQLAFAVTEIIKGGPEDDTDLLFNNLRMAGRKAMCETNADPTKLQWLQRGKFGWAQMKSIGFHQPMGEGSDIMWPIVGANGAPIAQVWFALTEQSQLYCTDVTEMGIVKNLAVIAGYVGA